MVVTHGVKPFLNKRTGVLDASQSRPPQAQYYETSSDIGYVVLDADALVADSQRVLSEIRALEGTIRARLVYEHRG